MAAKKEATFTIEIVPGEPIGPFRLGMTSIELGEAIRSLGTDAPITLDTSALWLGAVVMTETGSTRQKLGTV